MPLEPSDPRKRASTRKAVRKFTHEKGHPRDRRERGRGLLVSAEGKDIYEKTAWIKGQREAMRLLREMGTLISRDFVAARLAEVSRRVHDALDLVPDRVACELEGMKADQIRARLRVEINSALSALANALELGQNAVDVKRATRKGYRGVKRARPLKVPTPA